MTPNNYTVRSYLRKVGPAWYPLIAILEAHGLEVPSPAFWPWPSYLSLLLCA